MRKPAILQRPAPPQRARDRRGRLVPVRWHRGLARSDIAWPAGKLRWLARRRLLLTTSPVELVGRELSVPRFVRRQGFRRNAVRRDVWLHTIRRSFVPPTAAFRVLWCDNCCRRSECRWQPSGRDAESADYGRVSGQQPCNSSTAYGTRCIEIPCYRARADDATDRRIWRPDGIACKVDSARISLASCAGHGSPCSGRPCDTSGSVETSHTRRLRRQFAHRRGIGDRQAATRYSGPRIGRLA